MQHARNDISLQVLDLIQTLNSVFVALRARGCVDTGTSESLISDIRDDTQFACVICHAASVLRASNVCARSNVHCSHPLARLANAWRRSLQLFEILFLLIFALAIFRLVRGPTHRRLNYSTLFVAGLGAMTLGVIFEGWRWQMMAAYVGFIVLTLASLKKSETKLAWRIAGALP